jgi:hypothetical protein
MIDAPPSTWMVCPLMKLASSMHSKVTALPMRARVPIGAP